MRRISVIRNEQIVPLLGKPLTDSVFSPWSDLILEKHCVGTIEIPAHEHSSFCLQMQTSGPSQMEGGPREDLGRSPWARDPSSC